MTLSLVPREGETIEGAGRALRAGRMTCVGLVERCPHFPFNAWVPDKLIDSSCQVDCLVYIEHKWLPIGAHRVINFLTRWAD